MIRREARLRREFIYRKSLEDKQGAIQERRDRVKNAMDKNSAIPTDLRKDAVLMVKDFAWGGQADNVDDEYRWAGCEDPIIVVTTSRNPSSKLKIFAKEMKLVLPNSRRINRGHHDIKGIVHACKANGWCLTKQEGLANVVMRHDIPECGPMSEQYPHLIFHNVNSKIGERHIYKKGEGSDIELVEQGPRFEMRPYCILLGTIDNAESSEQNGPSEVTLIRRRIFLSTDEG
uniref:Brix domain-containing protein n=1 Tax=Ditylenchus dipsaci TaxID=166011 RepID=A0A915EUG4_9BILA